MSELKHIETVKRDDIIIVTFKAQRLISDYPVEELGEEMLALIEKEGAKKLLVDFANISYMCSSALSRFVLLQIKANECGCAIIFVNVCPILNQIFTATGMYRLMDIRSSLEDGLVSFQN